MDGAGTYAVTFLNENSGMRKRDTFQDVDETAAIKQAKAMYPDYKFVECIVKQKSNSEIRADRKEFVAKAAKARDDSAMALLEQQSAREAKKAARKKKSK